MSSISLRFNEVIIEDDKEEKIPEDLANYKHQLALNSCTTYDYGVGYIDPHIHPNKVDFMFRKKIKLFIGHLQEAFLVTEDGEKHCWSIGMNYLFAGLRENEDENEDEDEDGIDMIWTEEISSCIQYYPHKIDWSHTRIVKTATNILNFLALTDDGKIYYKNICGERTLQGIYQMDIKEKIIHFACGCNFYVVATDNDKVYTWGINLDGQLGISTDGTEYIGKACEVVALSGKTIVKVVCGKDHTLVLIDEGKVYAWGGNDHGQLDFTQDFNNRDNVLSPIMVNISNVNKMSDIAAINHISAVKSSEDGLFYIWGFLIFLTIEKPIACEYTNIFDICNSMTAHSSISMERIYTDEECSILNDLEVAFNDCSTSDLTIEVMEQSIYVHKIILKIRSSYFRQMFQFNWIENNKSVITYNDHSYVTYKTFLKYLYTGTINLSSLHDKLELLKLADKYGEKNLERDCIHMIKTEVTVSNIFYINEIAQKYNKKDLEEYCFSFYLKNTKSILCTEDYAQLDLDAKNRLAIKVKDFFNVC